MQNYPLVKLTLWFCHAPPRFPFHSIQPFKDAQKCVVSNRLLHLYAQTNTQQPEFTHNSTAHGG